MFPEEKPGGDIKAIACLALRHNFQTQLIFLISFLFIFFHEECMDVPL